MATFSEPLGHLQTKVLLKAETILLVKHGISSGSK